MFLVSHRSDFVSEAYYRGRFVPRTCFDRVPAGTVLAGTQLFRTRSDYKKWCCTENMFWEHVPAGTVPRTSVNAGCLIIWLWYIFSHQGPGCNLILVFWPVCFYCFMLLLQKCNSIFCFYIPSMWHFICTLIINRYYTCTCYAIFKIKCTMRVCKTKHILGVKKNFCYFSSLITFYYIHEW